MYLEEAARAEAPAHLAAIFEESQASSRDLLLSNPFTLPLPGLPRASGESGDFARLVRERLEEFRSRLPLFNSLLVPVTLTFMVVPPRAGQGSGQHRAHRPAHRPRSAPAAYRATPPGALLPR
jgi:hypothetical protein